MDRTHAAMAVMWCEYSVQLSSSWIGSTDNQSERWKLRAVSHYILSVLYSTTEQPLGNGKYYLGLHIHITSKAGGAI